MRQVSLGAAEAALVAAVASWVMVCAALDASAAAAAAAAAATAAASVSEDAPACSPSMGTLVDNH